MVSEILEFILLLLIILTFTKLHIKSNIFFNYIRIKIKVIGLDIEIKSKEKSAPSSQDKR